MGGHRYYRRPLPGPSKAKYEVPKATIQPIEVEPTFNTAAGRILLPYNAPVTNIRQMPVLLPSAPQAMPLPPKPTFLALPPASVVRGDNFIMYRKKGGKIYRAQNGFSTD